MFGADGRAPWARGLSSSGGTPAVAKGGSLLGLHLPQLPVFGGRLAAPPALDGWVKAVVAASRPAGRATVQLSVRGALPGSDPSIWARGAHLMLALVPGGAERPYTPFVLADKPGQFELLVKAYDGGELSAALAALRPGAELRLKGPLSGSTGVRADAEEIGLVAGGTGITPMLQLLLPLVQRAQASGTPTPRVHVLCFNRTEEDILLHEQLQQFCATSARVHVEHCLTNPPKGWAGIAGRPTASLLAHALTMKPGPQVQLFYCGPPSFNSAVRDALGELGFTDEMVHEFS
jgi:cytochrome-b5 reductase